MIEIKLYQPSFKEDFKKLNLRWIEKYFEVEPKDESQLDHPEEIINKGGQIIFGLIDSKVIGCCGVIYDQPGVYEIAKMAVDDSLQGQGIGRQLLEAAEHWATNQGAIRIIIFSNSSLKAAIHLYHSMGYSTVKQGPHPDYKRANIELEKLVK